ncbi:MAG: arylesterase [Pyrinomonadaceae bacterium]
MFNFIRFTAIIIFTAAALIISGCGASSAEKQFTGNANKPMITPNIATGRPKIVAFGDSLTAGFGLAEKESYPYLLQKKLEAGGYRYEVVNAGISGETSLGGLERVDWVLEQENVEILILELGANDLLRGLPVAKMKDNLAKIIKKAQAKKITVLLCGMLAPSSVGAQYQRDYSNAFPDLATEYKVAFLPFLLENVALNKDLNQGDGIHPNAKGEIIMTDNIYKALQPLLKK